MADETTTEIDALLAHSMRKDLYVILTRPVRSEEIAKRRKEHFA